MAYRAKLRVDSGRRVTVYVAMRTDVLVRVSMELVLRLRSYGVMRWIEALAPFAVYWILCAYFTLRGSDSRTDISYEKNSVSRAQVLWSVGTLHLTGVFSNIAYLILVEHRGVDTLRWTHLLLGMFVIDTVEYWVHRLLHTRLFYKHFHKEHHRLKVPYSYAALYNGWTEIFVTSPLIGLGFYVCGLAWRELLIVTAAAYAATAHQHTFTRRDAHHWRHHEVAPNTNFSQPFLPYWDYICGTMYVERSFSSSANVAENK